MEERIQKRKNSKSIQGKQKKTRQYSNGSKPRTPKNKKSSSTSSAPPSASYSNATSNKPSVLRFDQPLKYPRKRKINDNNLMSGSINSTKTNGKHNNANANSKSARPTFQFKIGLQVGVALGECFLQLQKLETSMDQLRNVSEDITDVMTCIEQLGGTKALEQNKKKNSLGDADDDPIEEVHVLNENLTKWQRDAQKRMKNVGNTVSKLHGKLEQLDEHHARAQQHAFMQQQQDRSDMESAFQTITRLQDEVRVAKKEANEKYLEVKKLKKSKSDSHASSYDMEDRNETVKKKLDALEQKEKELDHDAEIIATQSEELRKESERLLTERDEVRKQKDQWQKMIDEVKEQKSKLEKRESELQANHKKLLELHETLSEEKKKLHKKAKKIKAREKRLNALRAAQSQQYQQPLQNQYQVPSSNGSDYAESELTYFSDGDTELASVNSISDDESQENNYHKQQLQKLAHLGVPNPPMY